MDTSTRTLYALIKNYMNMQKEQGTKEELIDHKAIEKRLTRLLPAYASIFNIPIKKTSETKYTIPENLSKFLYLELDIAYFSETNATVQSEYNSNIRIRILHSIANKEWEKVLKRNLSLFFMPFYTIIDTNFSEIHRRATELMYYYYQTIPTEYSKSDVFTQDLNNLVISIYDHSKLPDTYKYEDYKQKHANTLKTILSSKNF